MCQGLCIMVKYSKVLLILSISVSNNDMDVTPKFASNHQKIVFFLCRTIYSSIPYLHVCAPNPTIHLTTENTYPFMANPTIEIIFQIRGYHGPNLDLNPQSVSLESNCPLSIKCMILHALLLLSVLVSQIYHSFGLHPPIFFSEYSKCEWPPDVSCILFYIVGGGQLKQV